ncbi:hypothetical protein B0H14DRAFT_2558716 [Mycena olivaceomarginata]|nr:hypothetical protein B0H14DRAFT_2558716 [Mycena olivaceomarginata]
MPSGVSMTGLAFLTNPQRVGRSLTWMFDASFYLNVTKDEEGKDVVNGTCGCLRYFNTGSELDFSQVGLYVVHAWVGQSAAGYSLGEDIDHADYDFVGDIQWLMPLHEEEDTREGGDSASIHSSRDGEDPEPTEAKLRMPKIKTDYRAYVNFCGLPFNGNKAAGKFDIDCEQYTQIAKGGPTTVFPASCWIINSPHWSPDKKPVPFSNRFISASGFLVGVEKRRVPGSPRTRCFIVDVDNVVYLGTNVTAGRATPAASSSNGKRKFTPTPSFDSTPNWVKRHKNQSGAPSSSPR